MNAHPLLHFNGINGSTGEYLTPALPAQAVAQLARGAKLNPEELADLRWWIHRRKPHFAPRVGIDPKSLDEAGWGVIFAYDEDPAVREALQELLEHRKAQASARKEHYYREFSGPNGYRSMDGSFETKKDFLIRQGAASNGAADPEKVPYYLLIVGSPEKIPFSFQYQLDVQYAVGRIHFDTLEEYARYARSVVEAESGRVKLPRRAVFFGVRSPGDRSTELSSNLLVNPLAEDFKTRSKGWEVETLLGGSATKSALGDVLGGARTPALLFTASHGMGFDNGDARQLPHQGALLCGDWPGPDEWRKPIPEEFYFSGSDVPDDAGLLGTIAFHFACYGAGTPRQDEFAHEIGCRQEIAPHAFLAGLPKRLLGHPKGGALAVIGHVERAWGYSFLAERGTAVQRQTATFEDTLTQLIHDHPVGSALELFNQRYAELSTDLSTMLEGIRFRDMPDDYALAGTWTANNDARAYVIIGDPAVRLCVSEYVEISAERPRIDLTNLPVPPRAPGEDPSAVEPAEGATGTDVSLHAAGELEFNLFGGGKPAPPPEPAVNGLNDLTQQLLGWLGRAIQDAATLEVSTYVSDEMGGAKLEPNGGVSDARLRAYTQISLDGDIKMCVPAETGEIDETLWTIHSEMVVRAQAYRMEMIKTAGAVAADFLKALKP